MAKRTLTKSQELIALFRHIFSANRRNKAKILVAEWLLGIKGLFVSSNRVFGKDTSDERLDTWQFSETREVDVEYFKSNTPTLTENHLTDDGVVEVNHEYMIHRLHGATSYTNESTHRSIFNYQGKRVQSISSTRKGARAPSKLRLPVSRTVTGVTANLYGNMAVSEGNYFHWLVDAMSRIFILERFYNLDEIDQVLVPPLKYDFHWDGLAALGFDRDRIIELTALECIEFECLLASTPPRGSSSVFVPGWIIDGYEKMLKGSARKVSSIAGKRIYVSRRDAPTRMFSNEEEVCDFLEGRGFDIVEMSPLDLPNKIAVFRDADVIISQTGAGLTNLMFCHENLTVIELVDERFVYLPYASLAWYKKASYRAHLFSNESVLGKANAMVSKSYLDIKELEKTLVKMGV